MKIMFSQIVATPGVLGGRARIKDTRISVSLLLEMFAGGATIETLLRRYPELTKEGVEQALMYASSTLANESYDFIPAQSEA